MRTTSVSSTVRASASRWVCVWLAIEYAYMPHRKGIRDHEQQQKQQLQQRQSLPNERPNFAKLFRKTDRAEIRSEIKSIGLQSDHVVMLWFIHRIAI